MLTTRATADELMDAADLAPDTYARVLHDLARVNTVTMARRPTLDFIARAARQRPGRRLRILDVGFGDGDMLRAIASATRGKIDVELIGVDLNPGSAPTARAATAPDLAIDYRTGDYVDVEEPIDFVISSLVAHHMTRAQLVAFLRYMERVARVGWFVNDLERHGFAYHGYPLLARLMRWHPIVRHDGQLSIARSYRAAEWPPLLADADITTANVRRQFPFRLCVERLR